MESVSVFDVQSLLDDGKGVLEHAVEAKIIWMAAIDGAVIEADGIEEMVAVEEIDILVSGLDGVVVSGFNAITTSSAIGGVRLGENENRHIRAGGADDFEERLMRLLEMFERRRVVVVVIDEHGGVDLGDGFGHGGFAASGAGEPEIDLRDVQSAANHCRVVISGAGATSALRDAGAVENDWFGKALRRGRLEFRIGSDTYFQFVDGGIERKEDDVVAHGVATDVDDGAFLCCARPFHVTVTPY